MLTNGPAPFGRDVLAIDAPHTAGVIQNAIRVQVLTVLKRRGAVVGVSGGIDSAVVAALCARALGPERVVALLMPERDSSADSLRLGRLVASAFGIRTIVEDIEPTLAAAGCYARQIEAIRSVVPEYSARYRCKITLPSILSRDRLNVSELTFEAPSGASQTVRLTAEAYRQLVAATNFKQRVRTVMEYYHADRLHFAVAGTPNRLEYDQGFFVKQGDGAADLKPIAHLYKTQVFALAEHLCVPVEVRRRRPTTDTFSMPQTQEEFYFSLPYEQMDLCLYGRNHGISPAAVARAAGLTDVQVERVYRDIDRKRQATRYLQTPPLLVAALEEVHA